MSYNFTPPVSFVAPKVPTYTAGYLIIECDDGNVGDYTHWYPKSIHLSNRHNQWQSYFIKFCPCINSGHINESGKITTAQLQTLYTAGWEILVHGRHHIGIGKHELAANVNAGVSQIMIDGIFRRMGMHLVSSLGYPYQYRIWDDTNEEIVTIVNHDDNTSILTLESPLENGYAAGSFFQLTDDDMLDLIQGCVNELLTWGVATENYTFAYHSGSSYFPSTESVELIRNMFNSGRGEYGTTNNPIAADWAKLEGLDIGGTSFETISNALDDAANNDLLLIVYGHGETSDEVMKKLEHLIDGAMSRGIRILTRREAVELLKP